MEETQLCTEVKEIKNAVSGLVDVLAKLTKKERKKKEKEFAEEAPMQDRDPDQSVGTKKAPAKDLSMEELSKTIKK